MTADISTMKIALDPAGRIAQDIPCIDCGYSLRSLLPEQACPECGQPVSPSLRGDRLAFSNPRWVARLRNGFAWILASSALACIGNRTGHFGILPNLFILLAMLVGTWLATTPETGLAGTDRDSRTRKAAHFLLPASLLASLGPWLYILFTGPVSLRWTFLISALTTLLGAAGWLAFCIYISGLARRSSPSRLARFGLCAGIGLGLLGLASVGMSAWLDSLHPKDPIFIAPGNSVVQTVWAILRVCANLKEAVILLVAVFYLRLFRRETHLARRVAEDAAVVAGTPA